jgi:hypothetical protein
MLLFVTGCAKHVTIRPPLNASLGFPVFQALGEINRAPVHIGLLLEPKLQNEKISLSRDLGTAEIAVGEVLSSKLIQALSYKFERITLVTDISNAPSLLLSIGLDGEGPAVGVDMAMYSHLGSAGGTFEYTAKVDTRLRATLSDEGESIWIGHARMVEEMVAGGAGYGVIEGSSQAAELTSRITDKLVADLMLQMQRSTELKKFLERKKL